MNPKYLDSINNKVIYDLCVRIRRGSKISMAVARFSIHAYQALKKELSQVDEFCFIFTGSAFSLKLLSLKIVEHTSVVGIFSCSDDIEVALTAKII